MKQKQLLIAFAALVLTACGGSIDLGPKIPAPPIPVEEDDNGGACEVVEGEKFTFTFGADEDVLAVDGDEAEHGTWFKNDADSQLIIEHDQAEERLVIYPGSWPADQDAWRRQVHVRLQVDDEDVVLTDAQITAVIRIPDAYSDQTKFRMELAVQADEGANYTNTQRRFDDGDDTLVADEEYTWVWTLGNMTGANAFGIGFHDEPDDLSILDPIYVYSVEIQLAGEQNCDEEPELVEQELPIDEGWYVGDDIAGDDTPNPTAVDYTSEGAGFAPTFEGDWSPKLFYLLDGPIDLAGGSLTIEFTVEQVFLDAEASIDVLVQQNFGSHAQHKCAVDSDDLTADESVTIICENIPATMAADEGQSLRLGVEVGDQDPGTDVGTITINGLSVSYYADGPGESTSGEGVDMTSGWDAGGQTMGYSEDGAYYEPTDDNQQFFATVTGPLVMDGGNFVITVSGDADFIASGANIQPFAQGIEDGGKAVWSCWINGSDLSEDPAEFTCSGFSDFELEEGETAKFGIQGKPGSDPIAGSVTVHSLIITPGE